MNYLYTLLAIAILLITLLSCATDRDAWKAQQVIRVQFLMEHECHRVTDKIWNCNDGYYIEMNNRFKEIRGRR